MFLTVFPMFLCVHRVTCFLLKNSSVAGATPLMSWVTAADEQGSYSKQTIGPSQHTLGCLGRILAPPQTKNKKKKTNNQHHNKKTNKKQEETKNKNGQNKKDIKTKN